MNLYKRRNYGFDLVRATEAAAITAGRFMGLGKTKLKQADQLATQAMRQAFDTLDMQGYIVIGEESKLGVSSSLDSGQIIGSGNGPEMDVVVDPIDGRRLLIQGQPGAVTVAGIAPRGTMWSPNPAAYMEKIVVDRDIAEALVPEMMDAPAAWTLSLIASIKQKEIRDLIVFVLNRPRHRDLIDEIRAVGARVMKRQDGDIAGALLAATGNIDVLMGIGGAAEGIIAACGVKSLGGAMLARLAPQSDKERAAIEKAGLDPTKILTCDDMIKSDEVFFAVTGITDGPLLDGVHYQGKWTKTHSLLLRHETRARRFIRAERLLE